MGFLAECGGTHVRLPKPDRAQTLLAQPLTMFAATLTREDLGLDDEDMADLIGNSKHVKPTTSKGRTTQKTSPRPSRGQGRLAQSPSPHQRPI